MLKKKHLYFFKKSKLLLYAVVGIIAIGSFFWYINNNAEKSSASDHNIGVTLFSSTTVNINQQFPLIVEARSDVYDLAASDLYLSYDTSIFTYDGYEHITPGLFDDEIINEIVPLEGNNKAIHLVHIAKQTTVTQSGIGIFRFKFTPIKSGQSTITLLTTQPHKSGLYGIHKTTNQPVEFNIVPSEITKLVTIQDVPTATPIPPTNTPVPPTNTPIPPTATNTPIPTIDTCPNFASGNASCDADGKVTLADFACWRYDFVHGSTATNCRRADFNNDTNVTLYDFAIWRSGFINGNNGTPP